MKIYIIRHGETDANKMAIMQGVLDWPLNDYGIKLAKITGKNMKDIKFDACFSSPLIRAKQTAEIVLEHSDNNVEIQYDDRIKELNMGTFEGKKARPGELEVPVIRSTLFRWNPFFCGTFPEGENAFELCARTKDFLKELSKKEYNNVLVSTHGGATRAMLNMFYINKLSFWQEHVPYNCAVNIVEVENGKMELIEKDKIYYDEKYIVDRYNFKK